MPGKPLVSLSAQNAAQLMRYAISVGWQREEFLDACRTALVAEATRRGKEAGGTLHPDQVLAVQRGCVPLCGNLDDLEAHMANCPNAQPEVPR